ncbi:hypothetical protein [Anaerotruncus sp. 1XD42-93]|uniref:hypothetical protein n=1 Tax=Anaerotruncus sp. 1XD42-93 TaxID=2320853 RepID=UPI000EA303E2|nr:hypothetical protein [Anaerotruncus sp. 1XD42-93]NBK20330.1 hypothetical protein [Anaerotruncus sp. 1XD42-93]RKJ70984.1 hypothetical protein D7Y41_36010 [Anaerotruncus sp. 1XD22-93]
MDAIAVMTASTTPLPTLSITEEMLEPLIQGVIANVTVILPIGLGLMAIFLGIRIIPGLISRFTRM